MDCNATLRLFITLLLWQPYVLYSNNFKDSIESKAIFYTSRIVACEGIAADSINVILMQWRTECGSSEPVERLQVLKLIDSGDTMLFREEFSNYLLNYLVAFEKRIHVSNNSSLRYFMYREEYGFVHPNGSFDTWTESEANKQLGKLKVGSEKYIAALLYSGKMRAFQMTMDTTSIKWIKNIAKKASWPKHNSFGPFIEFGIGMRLPVENYYQIVNRGVYFGGAWGLRWHKFDISIKYTNWDFTFRDSVLYNYKSDMRSLAMVRGNAIGICLGRPFFLNDSRIAFEPYVGVHCDLLTGTLSASTNYPRMEIIRFTPIEFSFGFSNLWLMSNSGIGINMEYNFVALDQSIFITKVTNSYVSIGLSYKLQ